MKKCKGCPLEGWGMIEDTTGICAHDLVDFPHGKCYLNLADIDAINLRLDGRVDRLVPMKVCPICEGIGEAWNPEARHNLSACRRCGGHQYVEDWDIREEA